MEIKRLEGAIEAILFTMGDAVELGQIAKAIQQDKPTTEKLIHNLMDKYRDEGRGIQIIELEDSYQLCTKRDYYGCLIRIAMQPKKPALTDVMLETLSIIAYKQPVTKAEIEKIRGVKSDHAVNKLVEYNLVKELGRLDAPGRPIPRRDNGYIVRFSDLPSSNVFFHLPNSFAHHLPIFQNSALPVSLSFPFSESPEFFTDGFLMHLFGAVSS